MDHIVNVTLTLAASNLYFTGHKEKVGQPNNVNVLAIIDLLSKYNTLLQEIIHEQCEVYESQNSKLTHPAFI